MAKKKSKSKKTSAKKNEGKSDISAALAAMDDDGGYGDVDANEGGTFEDVPEGKYGVRIDKAEVNHSKGTGRLQVSVEMTIQGGEFNGRKLWKHDGIDNEQSIGYFKGGLVRLGLEAPESAVDIPETLEELIGSFAQVTVKIKGEYTNTYFDKALDEDELDDDIPEIDEDGAEEDEDVEEADDEAEEEADDEEEETSWAKGDRVTVDYDGEAFTGKIVKVDEDEEEAVVKFDDGSKETHSFDELSEEGDDEDEDEAEEVDEAEEADDDEIEEEDEAEADAAAEVEGVEIKFKKLNASHEKAVKKLAEQHEFDTDDYKDSVSLLTDIAEFVGVGGEWTKASDLIKACKKASD